MMFTFTGVVVALVHVLVPFMVLAVWASLQKLDAATEQAAQSLGAGLSTVMRRIVFPQVIPGVLSGGLIVFALGGQRLRHAGHHRRPATEGGADDDLRRVPRQPELAAGRGAGRGAGADRAGCVDGHEPAISSGSTSRCSCEQDSPPSAGVSPAVRGLHAGTAGDGGAGVVHRQGLHRDAVRRGVMALVPGDRGDAPTSSRHSGAAWGSAQRPRRSPRCSRCRPAWRSPGIAFRAAMRCRACCCRR